MWIWMNKNSVHPRHTLRWSDPSQLIHMLSFLHAAVCCCFVWRLPAHFGSPSTIRAHSPFIDGNFFISFSAALRPHAFFVPPLFIFKHKSWIWLRLHSQRCRLFLFFYLYIKLPFVCILIVEIANVEWRNVNVIECDNQHENDVCDFNMQIFSVQKCRFSISFTSTHCLRTIFFLNGKKHACNFSKHRNKSRFYWQIKIVFSIWKMLKW